MADAPAAPKDKLSTVPSWIMVGFIIGAIFAVGVQREITRRDKEQAAAKLPPPPPPPKVEVPPSLSAVKDRSSLSAIENVFVQYESNAVWRNDLTEVALWNAQTNKFSECFEVVRSGDVYYFRTIPHLTRPVIRPNMTPDLPLRFTEPEDEQMKRIKDHNSIWLPPTTDPN